MKKTQKQKVIDRIREVGYVDNFWSISTRTSIRLGAIIFELKKEGWEFETKMGDDKNCHYYPTKVPELKLF